MSPRFLTAGWVLPMDGPPIRTGAGLIGGDGRIEAVGATGSVPCPEDAERSDWPVAAILPGLVNTHTHLELTGFAGMADEDAFPDWIRRIRALKAERSADDFLAAARRGLADCHAAGVTTVADTGDSGAVIEALAEAG
jgi:cytosine/adenosine deaminase-related metal-dependent hydrolase